MPSSHLILCHSLFLLPSIFPSINTSRGVGQQRPAAWLGALSAAWDLLKEVTIIFITSTIVWPQVKQQGG